MLAISASLLGTLTPLSVGVVAGAVSAGLLIRDGYMNPGKKGYACFFWDSVTAIALLVVLQALAFVVLRSSGHLVSAVPWIAAQSVVGGASASFFRLIFKMPRDPFQRLFEDYQDIFPINVLWWIACIALYDGYRRSLTRRGLCTDCLPVHCGLCPDEAAVGQAGCSCAAFGEDKRFKGVADVSAVDTVVYPIWDTHRQRFKAQRSPSGH